MSKQFCFVSAVVLLAIAAMFPVLAEEPLALESSYAGADMPWLRGNLHTHTTNSDGKRAPQDVVDAYAALGYDFLMISDHDMITDVSKLDPKGMTLVSGNEISAKGPHILHVGASARVNPEPDRQQVLDGVGKAGGFAIMNHPNWGATFNHCDYGILEKLNGYTGMEIYNGVIVWLEGAPEATDKWDRLLGAGKRVWGFATDDSHADEHRGMGWVMVQSASKKAEDIVEAMRNGRFYASTGVFLDGIGVSGDTVTVRARESVRFVVYADRGKVLHFSDGKELSYKVASADKQTYVRVECCGAGEAKAWTQPFFIKK